MSTKEPEQIESIETVNEDEAKETVKLEKEGKQADAARDQIDLYGNNFRQLIDPEPAVLSLFKFQMTRVQERTKNLVQLLHEAEKLIKADQLAAGALGKIGTHYAEDELRNLTEVASVRTMSAKQLEDGLIQAKSRLETFQLALHAVSQAEHEHEQVLYTIIFVRGKLS